MHNQFALYAAPRLLATSCMLVRRELVLRWNFQRRTNERRTNRHPDVSTVVREQLPAQDQDQTSMHDGFPWSIRCMVCSSQATS
jgi:hypothetical protein